MAEELNNNTSRQNEDHGAQNTGAGGNEPEKKYTDDEVNGIVAKKTRKAVDNFLKDLGISDRAAAENLLKGYAAQQTEQKNNAGNSDSELAQTVNALKNELEALRSNQKKDAVASEIKKKYQPKDVADILPFIDMEKVKFENNTISGLDEQIEPIKKSKDYLFERPGKSGLSHDGAIEYDNAALRRAFGLKDKKE